MLEKQDVEQATVPSEKILIKLISTENKIRGNIIVPDSSTCKDGIVVKIGDQLGKDYYNYKLNKRVPLNIEEGDYVYLDFIPAFSKFKVKDEIYVTVSPGVIIGKYNKAYYKAEVL